jgi:hypothetical protein
MRLLAAIAVLLLSACGGGGSGPNPFPTPTPGGPLLYVADSGNNAIFEFARTATGVDLPQTTISGGATLLVNPFPITVDPAGNIWVSNHSSPPELLSFSPKSVGAAAPATIMFVSSQGLPGALSVTGMIFNSSGKLYVATGTANHIMVYTSPGPGTPAATQDINGLSTQLNDAEGIAIDSAGNIYTASLGSNAVLEFAPGATGNVAPIRVIKGFFNTGLSSPSYVAVDSTGDVFALNSGDGVITEYAPGASGDVAPIATLTRSAMAGQIAIDSADNLYVGALNNNPGAVLVYAPPITSSSVPLRMLQSPVFFAPTGVFAP